MSSAATAAAVAANRSERRIISDLRAAGALSADHPAPLHPPGQTAHTLPHTLQGRILARLVRSGCVIQTENNLYWLDEAAYARHRDRRRGRVLLALFGIAALFLVAAAATIARADTRAPNATASTASNRVSPLAPTPLAAPRPPYSGPRPPAPPRPG